MPVALLSIRRSTALLDILKTEGIQPDQIRHIAVRFPKDGYKVIDNNELRSHCAQYVLSLAAYKRQVDFYDILHDQRCDVRIRSLSERIDVLGDEETNRTYPDLYRSILTVEMRDGTKHVRDITHPKGSPENPVSREVLEKKFAALTQDVIDPLRGKQIGEMIARMEEIEDIGEFSRLLSAACAM
jgi:2-methylcitrate dehydratase PrpD